MIEEGGEEIAVIDFSSKASWTSFFIIVQGRSGNHLRRMADAILNQVFNFLFFVDLNWMIDEFAIVEYSFVTKFMLHLFHMNLLLKEKRLKIGW